MEFLNQTIGKYQLTRVIGKVGISISVGFLFILFLEQLI
jgi:hypothetical protein